MADVRRRSFLGLISAFLTALLVRRTVALILPAESVLSQSAKRSPPAPVPSSKGPYWFADVASRSQFTYQTRNNFTGRKYFPQPMCGGVAAIDYNNDGLMDLFFTNGAKMPEMEKTSPAYYNCLLRNKGDGTFEDVTAKAGLTGSG